MGRPLNETADNNPKNLVLVVADMARSGPPMTGAFVAELTRGMHGRSAVLAMPLSWIEQWLADSGHTIEQLVQAESQQQAADQVSISNSIGSLRFLANMDWREFVETMSVVEQVLREDPGGHLRVDGFRHARRLPPRGRKGRAASGAGEVRGGALRAGAGPGRTTTGARHRVRHVGYYLVDDGIAETGSRGGRTGERQQAGAPALRAAMPLSAYLLPIGLIAGVLHLCAGAPKPVPTAFGCGLAVR